MDASARSNSPQTRKPAQTLGVSIAEWRFEMRLGHEMLCDGALEHALAHYERAATAAAGLAQLAQNAAFDADCAISALRDARENVAAVCLRLDRPEQAVATLELLFLGLCAGAGTSLAATAYRRACAQNLPRALETLTTQLEQCAAPPDRISSIYAIAAATEAQSSRLSAAA